MQILLALSLFGLASQAAPNKSKFMYIAEPELTQKLSAQPGLGAKLLGAVIEKEATLFPASVKNPDSGHGNPVVCVKTDVAESFLKEIKSTGLVFQPDPTGKVCKL